jgi:hypothetical protein
MIAKTLFRRVPQRRATLGPKMNRNFNGGYCRSPGEMLHACACIFQRVCLLFERRFEGERTSAK